MEGLEFPFAGEMTPEVKRGLISLLSRDDLRELRRPAWRPVAQQRAADPPASKYGGLPWLVEGDSWPVCRACGRPMHFFFQLNLHQAPAELREQYGQELIQFFYCRRGDCPQEGKLPPDRASLVKPVSLAQPGRLAFAHEGPEGPFPEYRIMSWQREIDYIPVLTELGRLNVRLTDEEYDLLADRDLIQTRDKLAGWPAWIQWPDYPRCSVCRQQMQHLFQFEPEVHLGYMLGQEFFDRPVDTGCGWLFQCRTHRDQLGFTWQCF